MLGTAHNIFVFALASVVFAPQPAFAAPVSDATLADLKNLHQLHTDREQVGHNPQRLLVNAVAYEQSGSGGAKTTGSGKKDGGQSAKPPAKGSQAPAAGKGGENQKPASQPTYVWALVLGTFTDGDHESEARHMLEQIQVIAPDVAQKSRVHSGSRGSMVIFGSYPSDDDEKAKADQAWLKGLTHNNQRLFARVILSRIDLRGQMTLPPNDLLNARKQHPKVDPLYTLDVAMWMTNTDRKLGDVVTYDQVRTKAEEYAAKLRTQGYEAYFYHDEVNQRSIVTVSLFDRRAIDPKSHLYTADVEELIKKFPARLVNGEPLYEFKDPLHPKAGTKPQQPKLVLVPSL